jgi:hemerythrin
LLKLLTYWFAPILGTDQFMAKQVVDIQAGVKPEDTYQAEKDIKEESSTEPLLLALNCLFQ